MLLAISIARPAVSHPPADLARVPGTLDLDWFYLFALPLQDHYSGLALWGVVGALTLLLLAAPCFRPCAGPPRRSSTSTTATAAAAAWRTVRSTR